MWSKQCPGGGKDLFLLMSGSTTVTALLRVLFGVCTHKLGEEREGKGKREKLRAYTSRQFGNQLDLLAISLLYSVRRLIRGEFNRISREVPVLCFFAHYPAPAT